MKIDKEQLNPGLVKLTIEVDSMGLKKAVDQVYKSYAQSTKIAGFRPGKAPKELLERTIGRSKIEAEVLEKIIPESYYQAIMSEKINTVGPPKVKVIKISLPLTLVYEAEAEIFPDINLPKLDTIKVKRNEIKVSDGEIEAILKDIRKSFAKFESVNRPAQKGDRIEVDFEGFVDNLPFDGNKSQNHPIILGEGKMVPGFEEGLIGLEKNQDKEIKVEFPTDYHAKHLAGKKAMFKIKMKEVAEIIQPPLDDSFAQQTGGTKTLTELKEKIKEEAMNTKIVQERERIENQIIDQLITKTELTVPEALVSEEEHRLFHQAEEGLVSQGLTLERYLAMTKKDLKEFQQELKPEAVKRMKTALILTQVAKDIEAKVTDAELQKETERILENSPAEKKTEINRYYQSAEGQQSIKNTLIGRQVLQYLYDKSVK